MAQMIQFDDNQNSRPPLCTACEEMLTDALDQTLSSADQAWFDRHIASCTQCSDMLADAQRGAAWLELLKSPRPEPSATLMERILAQTSGLQNEILSPIAVPIPAPSRSNILAFRPRMPKFAGWMANPQSQRLAMTAAMAFFSIALTLNLTGVRLDQLHASDLNPANVRKTYYEASADAVRYYDNLRVVRVMESRVDDLRETNDDNNRDQNTTTAPAPDQKSQPDNQPEQKPEQKAPEGGVSRRESPAPHPHLVLTAALAPSPVLKGRGFSRAVADPNQSGFSRRGNAEGPIQLVGNLSIPNRPTHISKLTQEGGLA